MYRLISPPADGYEQWRTCLEEFGDGPIDGSGFYSPTDVVDLSETAFELYLSNRAWWADKAIAPPEGLVNCTFFWIVDEPGTLLGFLAVRHELTEHLYLAGGHIGYSVRPSARNKGIARAALERGLEEAHALEISRVLVCAKDENVASQRVIEASGGQLENSINGMRRYWFEGAPTL